MLFDLGWSEILLIGTVALVFIGPKDLPKAMRVAGYWVRKARTLSREFQSSIDQMIREAELDEMRQELKKAAEFDLDKEFHNTIDPTGSLREGLKPPELPDFSATGTVPAASVEKRGETAAPAPGEAAPSHTETLLEPVPMIAGPASERDDIAAAESIPAPLGPPPLSPPPLSPPSPETGDHGFVPPKP
jgi:sec-independent protein translocase protein TatB